LSVACNCATLTPQRKPTGDNLMRLRVVGLVIVSLSLGTTGVANAQARKNPLINSDFSIWQRGTSFSQSVATDGLYTVDRWNVGYGCPLNNPGCTINPGVYAISRQAFTLGQTDVPGEPRHFVRWSQSTAASGIGFLDFSQQIEDVRTFAGQTVTISAYMKASATETVKFVTEQYFGTGGSPSSPAFTDNGGSPCSVGTTWQRCSFTTTLASISGKTIGTNDNSSLNVIISLPYNDDFQIDIADVQIELGSSATAFERLPIGRQLEDCQRYFQKSFNLEVAPGISYPGAFTFTRSGGSGIMPVHLHKSMRRPPIVTFYNPNNGVACCHNTQSLCSTYYPSYASSTCYWEGSSGNVTVSPGDIGENYFHVYIGGSAGDAITGQWTAEAEFIVP
jgi:hypothetical protein